MCGQRDLEMDRDTIEMIRTDFVGKRVRCIEMKDKYNPVPSGTEGTVRMVDDIGTIHVDWNNGQTLGLCMEEDRFEVINPHNPLNLIGKTITVEPKKCTNGLYENCGMYYRLQCKGCPMFK
jgi:hypothetical protein